MTVSEVVLPFELAALMQTVSAPSKQEIQPQSELRTLLPVPSPVPISPPEKDPPVSFATPTSQVDQPTDPRKRKLQGERSAAVRKRPKRTQTTPALDLADDAVRNALPLKFFCKPLSVVGQNAQDPAVSKRMQSMLEIRKRRKERSGQRERMLATAKTTGEAHEIRRNFEREEARHREAEHLLLNGMTEVREEEEGGEPDDEPTAHATTSPPTPPEPAPPHEPDPPEHGAQKVQIVDGKLVMDIEHPFKSLAPTSGRKQHAVHPRPVLEEVHHYYNQSHFLNGNNRKSPRWRPDEMELFYQGLAAWGLNFEAIARMIPGKTRKNVKNKYKSESIKAKGKIDQALTDKKRMGIIEYAEATGISF